MTETRTILKPSLQASRAHDYLYDPLYSLSSERDHARATFQANTNVARIRRVPEFKTMFSSLGHFPNHHVRIDGTDPVPSFIPRQWRGYSEQAREALIRYTKFNYDPNVRIPPKLHKEADVSGKDRYKFFRRPIIPFLQHIPPDVMLHTATEGILNNEDGQVESLPTPLTHNVYVQTDYRESETQTDPFSPEYICRPGSQSELLTLATLSFGQGLPAGLAEVEMIERARAKRQWEATLPPLNDLEKLEQRRKMMDEQERKEWAFREKEIEKLQGAKLKVLQKLLEDRDKKNADINSERLDSLWAKKQGEKEKKFDKIRAEHIKMIRKLTRKRMKVEGRLEKRDILKDYSDPGSQAYAPLSRVGIFLDYNSEQYKVKSRHLSTYQGLLELENSLPDYVMQPRIQAPKPKSASKRDYVNRKKRRQHELEEISKGIENSKKDKQEEKPLRYLEKIEKLKPRPVTPTIENPNEDDEKKELALIYIQKVIRGRAVQYKMFCGKEKRRELIKELRSTHALQEAEMTIKKQEKSALLQMQRRDKLIMQQENSIDKVLDQLEGSGLGDILDFLSKELIRFQEERRIHAFAMFAERQRRMREAEESGKRQLEERRRREEDEIFKQIIGVHKESVDAYLTNIMKGAVESTAEEQAQREIEEMAAKINKIAHAMENSRTHLESEEIVAEMVTSFLLPEVERINVRENVRRQQQKNLLAAHHIIHKEAENAIETVMNNMKDQT